MNGKEIKPEVEENQEGFKCPECGKVITNVFVESTCSQSAEIDDTGQITEYGEQDIGDTSSILCPECYGDISRHISG